MPYVAYHWGIEYGALFKLVSDMVHGITTIAQTIFGNASHATLAALQQTHNKTYHILFARMVRISMYGIGALLCVASGGIVATQVLHGQIVYNQYSSVLYLFGIITVAETACLVYEKRYIIQEQMQQVVFCNLFLYALVCIAYFFAPSVPLILIGIPSARLATYLLMPLITTHPCGN